MTDEAIAAFIIDTFEAGVPPGRYTNRPDDLGGPTRWGVTKVGLAAFRGVRPQAITTADIQAVTRDVAINVALELAIVRPGLWIVNDWRPKLVTADFNYNAGADDGIAALQRAAGAAADGIFGPVSLAAVQAADPLTLTVRAVANRQRVHWTRGVGAQAANLRGWMGRCTTLLLTVTA